MDSPNFYAIIPADVRYDRSLKPNAKLLYGEITALCNKEGFCWADNGYFADLYQVSKETISRWISQLELAKYLKLEHYPENGNSRKIYLNSVLTKKSIGIDKKVNRVLTKKSIGIDKKVNPIYENITINNTINKKEENALSFFEQNAPSEWENFLMRFRKKFEQSEWEKFCELFNCKVIEEQVEFTTGKLKARLTRFAINYTENLSKSETKVVQLKNHDTWQEKASRPTNII
jgi:hypothetical protein